MTGLSRIYLWSGDKYCMVVLCRRGDRNGVLQFLIIIVIA